MSVSLLFFMEVAIIIMKKMRRLNYGGENVEKTIKIRVKLGVWDLYHFLMQYNYKSFGGIFGVIISLCSLGYVVVTHGKHDAGVNIVFLLIGLLWTVIQPLLLLQKATQQAARNEAYKEALEYEFEENGIRIRQGKEEAEVLWENIVKAKEDKKQILLFTSRVHACILPKAQFTEELQEIKILIREKVGK